MEIDSRNSKDYDGAALFELKRLRDILDKIIVSMENGETIFPVVIRFSVINLALGIYESLIKARSRD